MRALATGLIYFGIFLAIGFAIRRWMRRHDVDLSDVQAQAGSNRRPRKVFLLGAWRTED
jgi:MFS superfamily sulfate permease-like transporter